MQHTQLGIMKLLTLTSQVKNRLKLVDPPLGKIHYLGAELDDLFSLPRVAIVGSRKPTPYGLKVTEQLAAELAQAGVVVISGLAFGVDITAHKAALSISGKTIAVLPSGLENIYPASHRNIAKDIMKRGAVLSEYPADYLPRAHDFLDRNRLIAGLSDIVIVTEAAERSGSLNTAAHAKAMSIPIAAVPGPITSTLSSGTNWLIKQGAHVVTDTADILRLLQITPQKKQVTLLGSNDVETAVLTCLAQHSADATALSAETLVDIQTLGSALTMLEIQGRIAQDAVGCWHITSTH